MGKMRYLIAITAWEDGYEGLLMCENGIVLERKTGREGSEIFRSLFSVFPVSEAALCLPDNMPLPVVPKKWKIHRESRGEALLRSYFGKENGAVLCIGNSVYAAAQRNGVLSVSSTPDWGKRRMATEAIRIGLHANGTWLRHALEEVTGLPKEDIPDYLATLSEEKRLRLSRLIREGAIVGDTVCLDLVQKALRAFCKTLQSVTENADLPLPLIMIGPPKQDMPLIKAAINERFPGAFSFRESAVPPIYGSVLGVAAAYKIPPDEGFRRRFLETYSLYI